MISEITNNPFRVLGLSANATREEIDQSYQVLVESLKQQGAPASAVREVEEAYRAVTSPEQHWRHAFYWFVSLFPKDEHAIQYVEEGNYEAAISIWDGKSNYASTHNKMLCYMLMSETEMGSPYYPMVFAQAIKLFLVEDEFQQFVECVGEKDKVAADEAKAFLDTVFSQTVADKPTLYTHLQYKDWLEYVRGKWVSEEAADARWEEVRQWYEMQARAKAREAAEKHNSSILYFLWMLIFPIGLVRLPYP